MIGFAFISYISRMVMIKQLVEKMGNTSSWKASKQQLFVFFLVVRFCLSSKLIGSSMLGRPSSPSSEPTNIICSPVMTDIAIENGPFIVFLPVKNDDLP